MITSPILPTATAPRRASRRWTLGRAVVAGRDRGRPQRLGAAARPAFPRDYGELLGRPFPPQGTFAASGGRPSMAARMAARAWAIRRRRAGRIIRRAADPAVGDRSRCSPGPLARPGGFWSACRHES